MSQRELIAYNEGAELEELNPYTFGSDAYWLFEKGRFDSPGIIE